MQRSVSQEALENARLEMEALRRDFVAEAGRLGRPPTRCGFENRLYTFRTEYRQAFLTAGEFARLRRREMPEQRAEFLLDPWNTAYWLRHKCSDDGSRRIVFLYSFGPNRRRDSTDWEHRGDDLRVMIFEPGAGRNPPVR